MVLSFFGGAEILQCGYHITNGSRESNAVLLIAIEAKYMKKWTDIFQTGTEVHEKGPEVHQKFRKKTCRSTRTYGPGIHKKFLSLFGRTDFLRCGFILLIGPVRVMKLHNLFNT
jgi:hypothetical protein